MKKLIFILIIGSIMTAQPQTFNRPFSPKKILSNQDIQSMFHDQVMNLSINLLDTQTGRPTKEVNQIWNGSAWENGTKKEYEYAPQKTKAENPLSPGLVSRYLFSWVSGAWSTTGHEEYSWDSESNLTQRRWYDMNGDPVGRETYSEPFINGQPAIKLVEYYDNNQWDNSMQFTYTYDANGCVLDEIHEWWNGSELIYWSRIQKYYKQGCCPERWVFTYWSGSAWEIYYMAAFTYANCMTDIVPFAYARSYWGYYYTCNPTLVLMGPTTNGTTMASIDSRDEYTYTNCLAMTYLMYYLGVLQSSIVYNYGQIPGKVSSVYDNSNQRLTSQVTQILSGNDLINNTRTWYSYEGLTLSAESNTGIPIDFSLKQNYPNPFNPSTTITFDLSEDSDVKISIYDMTGRLIRELVNQTMTVGSKTINWDGKDESGNPVSGGIYLYNLQTGDYSQTKKMVLMK